MTSLQITTKLSLEHILYVTLLPLWILFGIAWAALNIMWIGFSIRILSPEEIFVTGMGCALIGLAWGSLWIIRGGSNKS